ncbi:MAG TPA: hypothetical protein VGO78_20260 [Acidimicrobiales bacterium]|jgi:hypothetical protein|nr:hypothetical protein [Acidimicrobiales bacterium]
MRTFRLNIVFSGIDLDDDDVFGALAEFPDVVWRTQARLAFAIATVQATTALEAAELVTRQVTDAVPTARPVKLDPDLVSIPDIANRIGVTREAVRNWANGARQANFPVPKGIVGDGIKVWTWADVNGWLRRNLNLGDPETFPDERETVVINAAFADVGRRRSVAATAAAKWSVARTVRVATRTRTPTPACRSTHWISSHGAPRKSMGRAGGVHAAA